MSRISLTMMSAYRAGLGSQCAPRKRLSADDDERIQSGAGLAVCARKRSNMLFHCRYALCHYLQLSAQPLLVQPAWSAVPQWCVQHTYNTCLTIACWQFTGCCDARESERGVGAN